MICYRTGKCTVCRCMLAFFTPDILQAGAVKGLKLDPAKGRNSPDSKAGWRRRRARHLHSLSLRRSHTTWLPAARSLWTHSWQLEIWRRRKRKKRMEGGGGRSQFNFLVYTCCKSYGNMDDNLMSLLRVKNIKSEDHFWTKYNIFGFCVYLLLYPFH